MRMIDCVTQLVFRALFFCFFIFSVLFAVHGDCVQPINVLRRFDHKSTRIPYSMVSMVSIFCNLYIYFFFSNNISYCEFDRKTTVRAAVGIYKKRISKRVCEVFLYRVPFVNDSQQIIQYVRGQCVYFIVYRLFVRRPCQTADTQIKN